MLRAVDRSMGGLAEAFTDCGVRLGRRRKNLSLYKYNEVSRAFRVFFNSISNTDNEAFLRNPSIFD